MSTAIIIIIVVFAFIIGGMMTLLKNAKDKFPDTYDKSKTGFDDKDDWPERKVEPPEEREEQTKHAKEE